MGGPDDVGASGSGDNLMTRRIGFGDKKDGTGLVRREREQRKADADNRRAQAKAQTDARRAAAEERRTTRGADEPAPPVTAKGRSSVVPFIMLLAIVIAAAAFIVTMPTDPVEYDLELEQRFSAIGEVALLLARLAIPFVIVLAVVLIARNRKPRIKEAGSVPAPAKPRPLSARARRRAEREHVKELSEGVEQPNGCGRVVAGFFLLIWLCGWTTGIVFAISAFLEGGPESWFLAIWITAALFGWVIAAWKLLQIITGGDVENVKR